MNSLERRPCRIDFLRLIVVAAILAGAPPLLLRDRSPEPVQPMAPAAEPTHTRKEDSSFQPRSSAKLQKRYGLSLDITRSAHV